MQERISAYVERRLPASGGKSCFVNYFMLVKVQPDQRIQATALGSSQIFGRFINVYLAFSLNTEVRETSQ